MTRYAKLTLKRSQFETLTKEEQVLFLQCWHIIHEVAVLEKALLASGIEMEKTRGEELTASVCQLAFFAKHLAGVLHEAWEAIRKGYHGTSLSKTYNSKLSPQAQTSLSNLGQYFSQGSNMVSTLRNNFSFHSDLDRIEEGLSLMSGKDDFVAILGIPEGMFFCGLAEHMINAAMLNAIDSSDFQNAVNRLFRELVQDVGAWITFFSHEYCAMICGKFNPTPEDAEIEREVAVTDLVFPYFIRRSNEGTQPAGGAYVSPAAGSPSAHP